MIDLLQRVLADHLAVTRRHLLIALGVIVGAIVLVPVLAHVGGLAYLGFVFWIITP